MHLFDIVCGCAAILFVVLGIKRGFVEEVVRVVAVVGAFFAGLSLYRRGAGYLGFLHLNGAAVSVIAFLVIFLASVLAIALAGIVIKKIVHLTVLGWIDRVCGGALGFVKVFFIVWIVVMTVASLPFDGIKAWFRPSRFYSFFMVISPVLRARGLVPATGPVQDILKANPIPAITKALKNAASAGDSAIRKQQGAPVKKSSKPATSSSAK